MNNPILNDIDCLIHKNTQSNKLTQDDLYDAVEIADRIIKEGTSQRLRMLVMCEALQDRCEALQDELWDARWALMIQSPNYFEGQA